jgi:endonuclease/exonuclease/phosphatase family metal-dependent hydrolase
MAPAVHEELATFGGGSPNPGRGLLRVMTRNVYWGGDIGIILQTDLSDIPAVVAAVNIVWAQVQNSFIQERIAALVDEIEAERPHFVGFQEVVQIVVLDEIGQATGGYDFVELLQSEIDARGLPYSFLAVQDNTTTVLPKALGLVGGQPGVTEYVQFTERIAVLAHEQLRATEVAQGNYAATHSLGDFVEMKRGWIRVSSRRKGIPHHFVNTHLEIQPLAPIQGAQAQELINVVLAGLDGTTILMGDFNSDAEGESGGPSWTSTYGELMDAGFTDTWDLDRHRPQQVGYTCCQAADLRNEVSELDQRLDLILVKNSWHRQSRRPLSGRASVEILGEEPEDRTTPHDIWPSDHAGLAARIWFQPDPGRGR